MSVKISAMRSAQAPDAITNGRNPSPVLIAKHYSRSSPADTTAVRVEIQSVIIAHDFIIILQCTGRCSPVCARHAKLADGISGWKFPAIQQNLIITNMKVQRALFYP
jgi:hypothetical protein